MIEQIEKFINPVFKELNILEYLKVSYSDKADFQINTVFQIAKNENKNPLEIGNEIVKKINSLEGFSNFFEEVQFVQPGFINIFLSDVFINQLINEIINFGFNIEHKDEIYFLDYGGPNIAKPLHIGHLRPAIIGESLKRILKFAGYKVIGDVHLGDYGLQIGQVICGILEEKKDVNDIDIKYLNYIYPYMSGLCKNDKEIYEKCKKITYDFQNGMYREYYNKIKDVSLSDIKRIYKYLDVDFDLWLGESDTEPLIPYLLKVLEDKNILKDDEGAKVVFVKQEEDKKEMPPCMIISSDGTKMYATSDIATLMDRKKKYNPDYILYVTDARQSLHFEQVFRVCELSDVKGLTNLEHIPFGTINGADGKPFKTRSGEAIKLDELISEIRASFISKREDNRNMSEKDIDIIVNSIIKFTDLQNNREKSYNFDIAKFSDVSGKTGPYILYSAIRVRKILEDNKFKKSDVSFNIYNEIDRKLRFKILELKKYIDKAVTERMPSYIAEYVYDLCNIVNSFYQNINISKLENEEIKNDYLNVLNIAYEIIENCLYMLIISIPSVM